MPASAAFAEHPLSFSEDAEEERARLERLQRDDPIALQDALNTSSALVAAAKANDLEELREVVANAEDGELLQGFVLQALAVALRAVSLEMVRQLVDWGVPLQREELSQALHLVCEVTTRDNFSDAWRILELLAKGNFSGSIDINTPRSVDGWTPLCVACAEACLPLAFKLLELDADPNVITRANDTPVSLAKRRLPTDSEEQQEARGIICNMLRHHGGQESWRDALSKARRPARRPAPKAGGAAAAAEDGSAVVKQAVSSTHTRYSS